MGHSRSEGRQTGEREKMETYERTIKGENSKSKESKLAGMKRMSTTSCKNKMFTDKETAFRLKVSTLKKVIRIEGKGTAISLVEFKLTRQKRKTERFTEGCWWKTVPHGGGKRVGQIISLLSRPFHSL